MSDSEIANALNNVAVGRMYSMICADCCEKQHPEINRISNAAVIRLQDNYEMATSELFEIIREHYHDSMPNGNHFGDIQLLAKNVNGLMRNIIGTANINADRAWGRILVDSYTYEKLGKILSLLKIDIDDPKVREQLKESN